MYGREDYSLELQYEQAHANGLEDLKHADSDFHLVEEVLLYDIVDVVL